MAVINAAASSGGLEKSFPKKAENENINVLNAIKLAATIIAPEIFLFILNELEKYSLLIEISSPSRQIAENILMKDMENAYSANAVLPNCLPITIAHTKDDAMLTPLAEICFAILIIIKKRIR
ncbi:hypothetical protein [Pseudomonas helleri]|uniref:hypothetical protein n=1 Tax=Pseudomonas helleri TaxID=1608996 RepID=UPI0012978B88|nr:hypothetical protein [Pseudomonas helleri]MQT32194.1 hypothetical protein [Pseudomonas helleri]